VIRAILTDIEGTTSSLSFVKDVLFPYARERMAAFVHSHAGDPGIAPLLEDVRRSAGHGDMGVDAVAAQLVAWIDEDRKDTTLKVIQGMIWEQGYRNGDFHGHVYADAEAALRRWHGQGIRLYVYSSGSVQAQQQLFAHTEYGDLTGLFSGYFDTRSGAKQQSDSYRTIAREIGLPAQEILFLSDISAELDAAHAAGMQTCQLVRDGTPDLAAPHPQAVDFDHIGL
jgi:enolase-phosphatase E1